MKTACFPSGCTNIKEDENKWNASVVC